jgi:uncharacterized LabA/DUF88 family protein
MGGVVMLVAILIDGSFLLKKFKNKYKKNPSPEEIVAIANKTLDDEEFKDDELFRIYYYDCYPFDKKIKHPITAEEIDFAETPVFTARTNFLRTLALMPRIALRSGKLSFGGWNIPYWGIRKLRDGKDFQPDMIVCDLEQKQVDIKIGLDIAWLSSKSIVEKIVLFTSDSDFIPAMKFARREGVMVYLVHLGHGVKAGLKEHSDGVIEVEI